ncbi:MAG: LysE family translocator [Pyrinomonadaceae bacterium]|nr:LysE family translocator [Pyrinomonadaceae bacterium]
MPDWSTLILFAAAAAILVFTPGPNTLYIIARSIQHGRIAGIVSSLGVETGTLIHVAAAAFGISAVLVSSALAFNIVKYAGAAYLIYLGIRTLLTQEKVAAAETIEEKSLRRTFSQAVVVNVLNPKTAIFFFAFLPQFIDAERGAVATQILCFGAIVVMLGFTSGSVYSVLAGGIGNVLRGNRKFLRAQRYFAGSVYLGLGVTTALTGTTRR